MKHIVIVHRSSNEFKSASIKGIDRRRPEDVLFGLSRERAFPEYTRHVLWMDPLVLIYQKRLLPVGVCINFNGLLERPLDVLRPFMLVGS